MSHFDLDIDFTDANSGVTGANVKVNIPNTTLGSTNRYSVDDAGVARSPQPEHLATNLGIGSIAPFQGSTATGAYSSARAIGSTALGFHAIARIHQSLACGNQAQAIGYRAIALGPFANATAPNALAIGSYANAAYENSIAIGNAAKTTGPNQLVIGSNDGTYGISLGGRSAIAPQKSLVNNTTTEVFRVSLPNPSSASINYSIGLAIADATHTQSYSADVFDAFIHDASGYNSSSSTVGAVQVLGVGGLTVTHSITQPATDIMAVNVKSNTTGMTPTSILCYIQITINGVAVITLV